MFLVPAAVFAQENEEGEEEQPQPELTVTTGSRNYLVGRAISFDLTGSTIPEGMTIQEVLWNFGDGVRTTGEQVSHAYENPGSYTVRVTVSTDQGQFETNIDLEVFEDVIMLVTDGSAPEDAIELKRREAAQEGILLFVLRARGGGPEVVTEEDLANQLLDARDVLRRTNVVVTWTSGSVGANVISKFAQHTRQAGEFAFSDVNIEEKGIVILSETPFGVLAPVAQTAFNQLKPAYVLLTRPEALDLLLEPLTAPEVHQLILNSPLQHRILGSFSARAVTEITPLNFVSQGINFLVNQGVPISNITLVLMLPVIATILSFSRQVIGIKAFGIITPAMTTLSFLVMGLEYGLIVFSVILLAGTLTRIVLRRFHLLYLPRMALVLSTVSLAILVLFALGILVGNNAIVSFSIFPILILTLLAEEFIAVQFKSGAKNAFIITAWTILLAVACYFIVSWELIRTIIVSYPEVVLLAIPINLLLGRWTGLRLTEYLRFRKLLRYIQ